MIYPIPNYIFNWHIFPKLLVAYMQYYHTIVYFKICKLPNPAPEGHTETLQLTFILQVLARYIQYQLIYSTDIYFPKKIAAFIQNIYILSSSSSYQVLFKNITYVGSMGTEAVFVYLCILVYVYLQLRIYISDTRDYLLWGPVLSRNHCWQILIQYIWVYMPSLDCTLLSSREGGGGGAIFLEVHLPASNCHRQFNVFNVILCMMDFSSKDIHI